MSTTPAAAQTHAETEVTEAGETFRKAMISADSAALYRLTTDKLTYGHSSGKLETQAGFVNTLTSKKSVFTTIDLTDQTIQITGTTAVVRHILTATTNDSGKGPGAVKLSVLLVWVKGDKGWQLVARQAVKVPQA